ncbi:MAG: DUF2029 domain-containing protein [Chloroflexi bacterium]|nr:DUF2029 domain-containing protein [Chloroflexota bacterium]
MVNVLSRLRDPRRLLAILILGVTGGVILALLVARGELGGSDARAYWAGVRIWITGADPFHPEGAFLPYVYAPWSIPLFLPWAALPWSVAWFLWRGLSVLLFAWTVAWAYQRRPLATALLVLFLVMPIAVTLDTGNLQMFLVLAVFGAQFVGPKLGGALWALAATLKWFPAFLIVFLPPRARMWGVAYAAIGVLLAVATLPQTLVQIETAVNFPRPVRWDYLLLLWAGVPWLWRHPVADRLDDRRQLTMLVADARARTAAGWGRVRRDRARAWTDARHGLQSWLRAFFGADPRAP